MSATASTAQGPEALRWLSGADADLRGAATAFLGGVTWAEGIVVQDCSGAIVAANPRAGVLLGLSWDQMVGVTSMDPRWQAVSEAGIALPATGTLASSPSRPASRWCPL